MIVCLLVVLVGLAVVHYRRMTYWKRWGVPFMDPHLIFGNSQQFFTEQMTLAEDLKELYDRMKGHPLVGYYVGSFPALVINEPGLIKKVLIKDCKYFYDRGLHGSKYVPFLFQSLVTYTGQQWKHIRSKIYPTFSQNSMVIIFDKLLTCAEDLKEIMEDACEWKRPVDVKDIMSRLTIDNIALSSFGIQSKCLKGSNTEFYHNAYIFEQFLFRNFFLKVVVFVPKLMIIAMALTKFGLARSIMKIRRYFIGILWNNIKYRKENGVEEKDFLDLFIKLMDKGDDALTFKELAATAFSIYVGGYHTTETSLTFGLLELSLNRNVQDKLRKEMNEKLDKYKGEVTYECLMEMKYLDQVVNEILRKYPIIPLIVRECNEAYKFEGTNFTVEKGIKVWVSIFALHYDPEFYPDPDKFDPDRFTDEENKKRKPCTYMPFGEGHRTCIGKRLGLLQVKVALVQLIRSYVFTVNEKTIFPVGFEADNIFLAPRNKIWLNVTKVHDN